MISIEKEGYKFGLMIVVGLASLVIFAGTALYLSWWHMAKDYKRFALQMADEAVQHTNDIRSYTVKVENELVSLRREQALDPCDDTLIAWMRKRSYGSGFVVDFGYVQNGQLLCSAYGHLDKSIAIGKPDYRSSVADMTQNVHLPFGHDDVRYLVAVFPSGYTAIMRNDWGNSVDSQDASSSRISGTLNTLTGKILFSDGPVDENQLRKYAVAVVDHEARIDGRNIIALVPSGYSSYVGFAIISIADLEKGWWQSAA